MDEETIWKKKSSHLQVLQDSKPFEVKDYPQLCTWIIFDQKSYLRIFSRHKLWTMSSNLDDKRHGYNEIVKVTGSKAYI